MNVVMLPPSDRELDDAIEYYNDQLPGLGEQFYESFIKTIAYIGIAPTVWRKIGHNTRRINIKRFPYLILYVSHADELLITCIAHQHRDPIYYSNRIY